MTRTQRTIALLKRGWLTSLESASRGGVLSLSQRIGDLRLEESLSPDGFWTVPRYDISEKWVTTAGGARVKAWRIVADRG